MPPIIKLEDQNNLVSTKEFKLAKYNFEYFNPMQSRVFEIYQEDANVIIAAKTGSGKTIASEILAAKEIFVNKGKIIYLAPLKALTKEKLDDWSKSDHFFSGLKLSICTGDYRLTPERRKELASADIIVMTNEMLSSRIRNYKSENNEWLQEIKLLIVDESHLITVAGRGDHQEVSLMKFTEIVPNAKVVLLSATMPNNKEIAEWVSYVLNNKKTYLIDSVYRPCPLAVHYEMYNDKGSYEQVERNKVDAALDIINEHKDDKFLVFVHTKRTGEIAKRQIKKMGYNCEFHSADLSKEKREKIEHDFKYGDLQILVATNTLAWGINAPARRVIIVGVHRGMNEVETYDIHQEIGRSGRPGFDPRGDAYVLVPRSKADYHRSRLSKPEPVVSRLLDYAGTEEKPYYKTLAFHVVAEIHHGEVKTRNDVKKWYERSLGHFQSHALDDEVIDSTINLLIKCGAIREYDNELEATMVGKIASMFYYSPFDVADLNRNFNKLFDDGMEDNDLMLALSLGNIDAFKMGIVSKAEREAMASFNSKLSKAFGGNIIEPGIKGTYINFLLLNGLHNDIFAAAMRGVQADFSRLKMVLQALDSMFCKWEKKYFFDDLEIRMTYGVGKHLVDLCKIPNVGKARAEALYSAGIHTIQDVVSNQEKSKKALNLKNSDQIIKDAADLLMR